MSADRIAALAGLYSLAMILGALGFQYIGGIAPCEMCHWQRWPLDAAIVTGFVGAGMFVTGVVNRNAVLIFAALSLVLIAASGAIGAYQALVEWKLLPGPESCTGARFVFHGAADFAHSTPTVRCDEASWRLLGISLAGYNAIFSLGAAILGAYLLTAERAFPPKGKRQ